MDPITGAPPVVWCAGLTTLDVVHRADARPGPDQKITASRQDVAAGGPAANAAVTAVALGARAVLVSALGSGPVAAAARADLEAHGVLVHDVVGDREADMFPMAVSAVLVDDATGERSVVSPDGALATAPAATRTELETLAREHGLPDAVLLDGHHPAVARAVMTFLASLEPRPRVVLDAGRWRPFFEELLPAADVAALSADFQVPDHDDAVEGVLTLGARAVVVTHGPDPVEWRDTDGAVGTVEVPGATARDTLGAGDAFHGALAAALARGGELGDAVALAARVASTRVAHVGPRGWLEHLEDGW
ncbi:carbohydrate kinase [Xylanimonas oleitrophica]|uniref:Carbohydrate kinase n=1 Tax=Xylanimonas oleitrophica TaxID=2607479 RepID=A0A2W5WWH5_9MICO|nr:PfkB family carbohydrate kinase [Xylanimonas oleitrophica]PZR52646.1 carbohydrate kinase [Xylanimonas oleitrophica]